MATTFAFLVLPHVHLMDLAGPDQVLLEAIGYGADFKICYSGIDEIPVSSAGLPLARLTHFTQLDLKAGDFLIIPGAELSYIHSPEFRKHTDLLNWIVAQHKQGVNLCTICAGTFVLAYAGLLSGKNCTTHWKRTSELQACFPDLKVIENVLFTEADGIYTSAGIAAGIDLALHIVEELMGAHFAHKVAREMVVYNRRSGGQAQESVFMSYRNHIHTGIHQVQDWLQENLNGDTSVLHLATIANMSERNFTRIFKKETSLTVNEYITILRKEKIKSLLRNPDMSRAQIARACGLTSERHLNRLIDHNHRN